MIAKLELLIYFRSTSIEERQNNYLVYSPGALRFWVVPVKEKQKDNGKMFENGITLRKYLDEKGLDDCIEKFLDSF